MGGEVAAGLLAKLLALPGHEVASLKLLPTVMLSAWPGPDVELFGLRLPMLKFAGRAILGVRVLPDPLAGWCQFGI